MDNIKVDTTNRIVNSYRNMVFGLIQYIVKFIFPFIFRTVIIYKLGVEYAGIGSLFSSILQVLNLSELGFSTSVTYAMYEPVAKGNIEKICCLLSFFRKIYRIIGLFVLSAGLCLCPFVKFLIKGTYPSEINIYAIYIILLLTTCFSYLFYGYKSTLFVVFQRSDIISKIELIANFGMYLLQIVALIFLHNYYLYLTCGLLFTITNNLLIQLFSKKIYPDLFCKGNISKEEQNNLLKKTGKLFGHQLDVVIITSVDNIIISSFLGLSVLTIYNNYFLIINAFIGVMRMIATSFSASIGNSIALESKEKNFKNFMDFAYLIINISGIISILEFSLFQDFMKIWMGPDMLLDIKIVLLCCLSSHVRMTKRPGNMYKDAKGLWDVDMLKPYIAGIFNLITNIILVNFIGLYGVVISTIVSLEFIEKPWETFVIFKHYFKKGLRKYILMHFIITIKLIIICLVIYFLSRFFVVTNFGVFFIKGLALTVISIGIFVLLSFKDSHFIYVKDNLKKMIKK